MAEPGESTLPDTLGTVPRLLEGFGRQKTPESRGQFARQQMPALFRGGAEAEAQAKMGAFERDQEKIRKEAEAEREVVRGTRLESQKLDTGLQERGTFEAPEYKASDYAANSATRLLTAVLLGGVARTSARGQLEAIKAMQDAEEQGLAENFVAARNRFDEQEKTRLDNNKMLKDRFDRMIDLLSKDRNAALIEAKLIEGNLGKGIIAAELRAGNYTKAYDLFNKAIDAGDKTVFERLKATTKQTTGPDRRLKQGERFNEATGVIEAIPGSDIYKKQQANFTEDYRDALSTIDLTEEGISKLDSIVDPARADAFGYNFGGYSEYAGQFLPGGASDMRKDIESFKSVMKNTGLSLIRMGGSIGQITEREWPIIERLIASIDPVVSEEKARQTFGEIKARFQRLIDRTKNVYETQYSDSQFYRPLAGGASPSGGGEQPAAPAGPQPGTVQDGYRFKGGDPANSNNWEKI
jgi:hypothetical protein